MRAITSGLSFVVVVVVVVVTGGVSGWMRGGMRGCEGVGVNVY